MVNKTIRPIKTSKLSYNISNWLDMQLPEENEMRDEPIQLSIFDTNSDSKNYDYRMSLDKVKGELAKFGLTSNQSKVYIFLGKYGSKTAPEVCKALKLPRTETYHLLTTLQNKGIVSATFQHPIRFAALPLEKSIWTLVNAEKERVNALEKQETDNLVQLWNNIPDFHAGENEVKEDKFQMLQGTNHIHGKMKEMINNAKKEFFVLGSEKDFLKFYHSDFFAPLDSSKIDLKLLTSASDRTMYIFDDIDRTKVRRLCGGINDNLCFITKDSDELLFFTKNAGLATQQLGAMWTDSSALIHSMKLLFNQIWSKSKNIHL